VIERPEAAPGIALGRLDLDDVGPQVAQDAPAEVAVLGGQIEDAMARKGQ
jgi:hypothetical protein